MQVYIPKLICQKHIGRMNAEDFILNLFLEDDFSLNQSVALAMKSVDNLNHENLKIFEAVDHCEVTAIGVPTINRNNLFNGMIMQTYNDEDFRKMFRMTRTTLEKLIEHLQQKTPNVEKMIVPFAKKVYLTVWMLANRSSCKVAGDLFGLHKSSVNYIFHETCKLITDNQEDFIKWPSQEQQKLIMNRLQSAYNVPNCVGFIDCLKVRVKSPKRIVPEVLLQAVCDDKQKFLSIYIGQSCKVSDSVLFKESPLSAQMEDLIDQESHLIGDAAYPLKMNLITPFRRTSAMPNSEKIYNALLSQARSNTIRKAFGRLVNRFKRLKCLQANKVSDISVIVCAACVIHNFILLNEPNDEMEELVSFPELTLNCELGKHLTPIDKRKIICEYIDNYVFIQENDTVSIDYDHFQNFTQLSEYQLNHL